MKKRLNLLCSVIAIIALQATLAQCAPRIVVDSIHAYNKLQTPPDAEAFSYHSVYGYRRAFDYLRSRGFQIDEVTKGRLDEKTLAGSKMLFINLVSGDLPPFYVSEITAIKKYLESGGSLLLITDHTNCYYHAYKLAPLLEELGIKVTTETAADQPPDAIGDGNGWITITRFTKHPVTQNLRAVAFETGGTVDDRYAIATTSSQAWGDQWQFQPYGEGDDNKGGSAPGFYGDWVKNPGERSGALGVIAAKAVGKGRVVIVGDQNLFGDPFINYADNYRLWLNSVSWLAGVPELTRYENYLDWRKPRVLAYEEYTDAAWGETEKTGYYNLFVALGRRLWLFAGEDLSEDAQTLLFARDDYLLSPENLAAAVRHLRAGRQIVILGPATDKTGPYSSLTAQFGRVLGNAENTTATLMDLPVQVTTWPGCGRVITLPANRIFSNNHCSKPERRPEAEHAAMLDQMAEMLRGK